MTHWYAQRKPILLIVCLGAVGGCSSSDRPPGTATPRAGPPSFVGFGDAAKCQAGCVELAATIARAELGLDPTERSPGNAATASPLFEALKAQSQSSKGTIESVPLETVLEGMKAGAMPPTVLVHGTGHLHVLLGAIDVEGRLLCQVAHGEMPVSLVTRDQLARAGFLGAWRFTRTAEGVPIHVGSATVQIDKVCHNFGEVKSDQKLQSVFSLKNTGAERVVVDKPVASCRCTVPSLKEPRELAPGERLDIQILGQSGNAASQSDTVWLKFFEKGTGVSRRVALHLYASQRKSMRVTPKRLDFGRVIPGRSYGRVIRLEEVATDRFLLKDVDAGQLPIEYEVRDVRGKDGLMAYVVQLTLAVPDDEPGPRKGEVTIATDSHIRPRVVVPTQFEVRPWVAAVPSVMSLGTVSVGERRKEVIRFLPCNGDPLTIKVLSSPRECVVDVNSTARPPELLVTTELKQPGIWQGLIRVNADSPSRSDIVEVKCAGLCVHGG